MHNKVVFHAMKALNGFGFPVLRFNFRGAGLSEGEHDDGRGEVEDPSALRWLEQGFHLPVVFAGFSFGAATGLRAACPDPQVDARLRWACRCAWTIAVTASNFFPVPSPSCLSAANGPVRAARIGGAGGARAEPKKLVLIEGADHFFQDAWRDERDMSSGCGKLVSS